MLMARQEIAPERLDGATAVVIDVILATTTLLTILENGARVVYPVASLEEAESTCRKFGSAPLRGGEQGGDRIDGYDHGPLPEEYAPEVVADRDVVFVTTNGTRALSDSVLADTVLAGSLRNAPAVARYLEQSGTESIYLVCAGSGGRFDLEDFLGAAKIISCMNLDGWRLNDAAVLARDFGEVYRESVLDTLMQSRTGRWFVENDRMETLKFVADVGASTLVPEVFDGRLRVAGTEKVERK